MFSGTTCVLNATLVPYNHTMGRIELSFLCTNGTAVIDLVLSMKNHSYSSSLIVQIFLSLCLTL